MNRHIQIGMVFIGLCLLVGIGLAFATLVNREKPAGNETAAATSNMIDAPDNAQSEVVNAKAEPAPDFLVTDELRRNKPSWEDVGQGPNGTSFCVGQTARITNGSGRTLNIKRVIAGGDDASPIGTVAAGKTLAFDPGEVATWNIVDADEAGPLFQYEVTECTASGDIKPATPASVTDPTPAPPSQDAAAQKQGKCRLTVAGKKYIDGACFYTLEQGGDFQINDTADGSGYFAMLMKDDDGAEGFWNSERGASRAREHLGVLVRSGGCWKNADNEICLWGS